MALRRASDDGLRGARNVFDGVPSGILVIHLSHQRELARDVTAGILDILRMGASRRGM